MIAFFIFVIVFISFPLLMVSIAIKSWALALAGFVIGIIYLILLLWNGRSEFLEELKAYEVEVAEDARLKKIWNEAGPERVNARFWIYPSSDAKLKVWVRGEKKLEILLSLGLFQLATDASLKAAFQTMTALSLSEVRNQNMRHALMMRFERLKGPQGDFRFWFVSFWLYPLERLLKIARI